MPARDINANTAIQPAEPFHHQVAGHQNVLADTSGGLIIKPALAREIAFYQLVQSSSHPSDSSLSPLGRLEPFLAQFYGVLRLEGCLSEGSNELVDMEPVSEGQTQESVVLENLVRHYTQPNILDVKLGTTLHEPDATEAKKKKMQRDAETTTSKETGMRLTGCQTWHEPSRSYVLTPKSYGKSITASQLPEGLTRFFPLPTDEIPNLISPIPTLAASAPLSTTSASSHSHDEAVITVSPNGLADPSSSLTFAMPSTTVPSPSLLPGNSPNPAYNDHALSADLLLEVLQIVAAHIDELINVLQSIEARFVGSSVLIMYEGDPARLRLGLQIREEKEARRKQRLLRRAERRGPLVDASSREVAAADLHNGDEQEEGSSFFDSGGSDDGDSDSESGSDSDYDSGEDVSDHPQARSGSPLNADPAMDEGRRRTKCPAVTVKMIDFAHTRLVEGEGPDEGVLLGLRSFRGLLEGRTRAVTAATRTNGVA